MERQKSVEEASSCLHDVLIGQYVDVFSSGSAVLKETGEPVIIVWLAEKPKHVVLPEEQGGYSVLYQIYNPPSFF